MSSSTKTNKTVKEKLADEVGRLFIYTFLLFILFSIFNFYERLLNDDFGDMNIRYGYCVIEALILAKVIMIGQAIHLGEKFKHRPLVYPVLYKTIMFSIFMISLNLLEHFVVGYVNGHTISQTYQKIMHQTWHLVLAKNFIMVIIFAQFFMAQELSNALGKGRLYTLFFKRYWN